MKALICGGRDFDDVDFMVHHLEELHEEHGFTHIIHGDANGADTIGKEWAIERGLPETAYPANWTKFGNKAGFIRNQEMLDSNPDIDLVIAFPGGTGTDDMVNRAKSMNVRVWQSKYRLFKKEDKNLWFLSNFATGFGFYDQDGVYWNTSEHRYQALKSPILSEQDMIRKLSTPLMTKRFGKKINLRSDWDRVKDDVMLDTLRLKFASGSVVADLLLNTDNDYLVEFAPWGDTYWGVMIIGGKMVGQNKLGKLLMQVREELKEKSRR